MKAIHAFIVCLSIDHCLTRSVVQFCDQNFVDAVLWDGIDYKVTRNGLIATYDPRVKTVNPFVHTSDYHFPNERGLHYQSIYHIPRVPECSAMFNACHMINQLSGLTVYTTVREGDRDKQELEVFYRFRHIGRETPPSMAEIQMYVESNLLPKGKTPQRYRPSVYSPNDFSFIHITNRYDNFEPIMEVIELLPTGQTSRTYYALVDYKDVVFITSFWWNYDQNVYVIGEYKTGFGQQFVFILNKGPNSFSLRPMNMTVLEFFNCPQVTRNQMTTRIMNELTNQISEGIVIKSNLEIKPTVEVNTEVPAHGDREVTSHDPTVQVDVQEENVAKQTRPDSMTTNQYQIEYNNVSVEQSQDPEASSRILMVSELSDDDDYEPRSLSDFWKVFPVVVMFLILSVAIVLLTLGFVMVKNLDRLLSTKIDSKPLKTKSIDGLRNKRMRYSEQLNDFFIEEVLTSPKERHNTNGSTQTLESEKATEEKLL